MKSPAPIASLAAGMLIAFLAGRHAPAGGDHKAAPPGNTTNPPTGDQGGNRSTFEWTSTTAAARTLRLLEHIDRCESNADFRTLLAELETRADKSEKQRLLALLFAGWLQKDPTMALAEVRRVELLRHDSGRVGEAFLEWASMRPDQATAVISTVLDGRQSDPSARPPFLDGVDPPEFLLSMVAGSAASDPKRVASTLSRTKESHVRTPAIEVLLQTWYPDHAADVRQWAQAIEDDHLREAAVSATATKAGQQDDTEPGIAWALSLKNPDDQRTALAALTNQWSQRRAADAFTWTKNLSDESLKLALMPDVLRNLTVIDPGAAADWLNQYEAGPEMDASVAAYAKAIQFTNLSAALGSATAITDPELRQAVIDSIHRHTSQ